MEIVTSFQRLMQLAGKLGEARKIGDQVLIGKAKEKHDAYRDMCLLSDRMVLGMTVGQLLD